MTEIRQNRRDVDWPRLLPFLDLFSQPTFKVGDWTTAEGVLPSFSFSSETARFVEELHAAGVIADFDWPAWQHEAERLATNPEAVGNADLGTLQKLLTTHVRRDRFSEGHLAAVFESGHILAITF